MPWVEQQLTANGGAGSPSSFGRIVWPKAVFDFITNNNVTAMAVASGGSGYAVGDTFEIDLPGSPGQVVTGSSGADVYRAVGEVVSLASPPGAVATVRVRSAGAYSVIPSPSTGIPTNTLTGSGTGLTIDPTFAAPSWSDADTASPLAFTSYTNDFTDFEWMCVSTRSPNPVYVGMKSFTGAGSPQIGLKVFTGYNNTVTFESQPGASPGDYTSPVLTGGFRLNATESDPKLFLQWNERRLIMILSDAPRWQYGYMGLFIPFSDDPAANYPLPLFVAGTNVSQTTTINTAFNDNNQGDIRLGHAGVINPFSDVDNGVGDTTPYARRDNLSSSYLHYDKNGGSTQSDIDGFLWPAEFDTTNWTDAPQQESKSTDPDSYGNHALKEVLNSAWFDDSTAGDDTPGVGPYGVGGRTHFIAPITLIQDSASQVNVIGELEGMYKVHGVGLTEADEIEAEDGTRWLCFPDIGGSAPINHWCAIEIGKGGLA